ncbi:hypothetical protein [Pseudoruegeria sp. SK021]|uniref:hypothetical protein n=1 Tax=Pseudoruegeria sp. SK021 TaxID=1933035 RepID=UPI000A25D60E|nr:hypothetical protein [Pseudoruegeria sp. SK021]OSP55220.1 hypothetical protein BV911_08275 [Pseudoruegeria sp. SK021]
MEPSQSVPELVTAAQASAKASLDRVSESLRLMDGSTAQQDDLREATAAIEAAAVDIFSVFEARMQHHFKRGPFSRKLTAMLKQSGKTDLAKRVHHYYLLVNVLKHGKGASYRELLNAPNCPFIVTQSDDPAATEAGSSVALVDVTVPGFFDGLTATILEAYEFLEAN